VAQHFAGLIAHNGVVTEGQIASAGIVGHTEPTG